MDFIKFLIENIKENPAMWFVIVFTAIGYGTYSKKKKK